MKFIVGDERGWTALLPATLREVPRISEYEAVRTRTFQLRRDCDTCKFRFGEFGWADTTEFPVLGTTEIWRFANRTQDTHPIHIHLVQFQILDRVPFKVLPDGEVLADGIPVPPAPEEAGWKDVVKVPPDTMARVIMRFTGFKGNYVFHCHMLEHEDNDMMRQFTVVAPGRAPIVEKARAEPWRLWPPDLQMAPVKIVGVTDSSGAPASVHVTGVTQDEPLSHPSTDEVTAMDEQNWAEPGSVHGSESGQVAVHSTSVNDPCVDAATDETGRLYLRRDRRSGGNGRVYRVSFTAVAADGGQRDGFVLVSVPAEANVRRALDDGQIYDSLAGCAPTDGAAADHAAMAMKTEQQQAPPPPTEIRGVRLANGCAIVTYSLSQVAEVRLALFDVAGRRVADADDVMREAGIHKVSLAMGHARRGAYFVRMRVGGRDYTRTVTLTAAR